MALIGNLRNAWKLWSVQVPTIAGSLVTTYYEVLTPDQRAFVPEWVAHVCIIAAFFSTVLSRVVKQAPPPDTN